MGEIKVVLDGSGTSIISSEYVKSVSPHMNYILVNFAYTERNKWIMIEVDKSNPSEILVEPYVDHPDIDLIHRPDIGYMFGLGSLPFFGQDKTPNIECTGEPMCRCILCSPFDIIHMTKNQRASCAKPVNTLNTANDIVNGSRSMNNMLCMTCVEHSDILYLCGDGRRVCPVCCIIAKHVLKADCIIS